MFIEERSTQSGLLHTSSTFWTCVAWARHALLTTRCLLHSTGSLTVYYLTVGLRNAAAIPSKISLQRHWSRRIFVTWLGSFSGNTCHQRSACWIMSRVMRFADVLLCWYGTLFMLGNSALQSATETGV